MTSAERVLEALDFQPECQCGSGERWLPVVGWEGLYEVSSLGRVRSLGRWVTRRGAKKAQWRPPTILKPSINTRNGGYRQVNLHGIGPRRCLAVHALVCEAFHGRKPTPKHEVRHVNGDVSDNRPENIAWGTHRENILDKFIHGTDHNSVKTRCPAGHEYNEINTYRQPNRPHARFCRECKRIDNRMRARAAAATRRAA